MKTYLHYMQGALASLCAVAATLFTAMTIQAASPSNQYFTETFEGYQSGGAAFTGSSNLFSTNAFGEVDLPRSRIVDDFGGSGMTPGTEIFGPGAVFMNINKDLVATTSTFSGGYKLQTLYSFENGFVNGADGVFFSSSNQNAIALQVMLRVGEDGNGNLDWTTGIAMRFYQNGNLRIWTTVNGVESFSEAGKLSIDGLPKFYDGPIFLEIEDTGTDLLIYMDGVNVASFANVTAGTADGHIAIGTAAYHAGKVLNVSVIPEVASFAWFFGLAALGFAARRSRRRG